MSAFGMPFSRNPARLLRKLGYLFAVLCGIGASVLVLVFVINLPAFDEKLHPDLVSPPMAAPPPGANAHYALLGFRAAPGADFIAVGRQLRARYLGKHEAGEGTLTDADYAEILGTGAIDSGFTLGETCPEPTYVCGLRELVAALQQGDYDAAELELLLQRYAALLALPVLPYMGAHPEDLMLVPVYQAPIAAQRYALAERYSSGSSLVFLEHMAADLRFWKAMLREAPWLIDKMIAVGALRLDMQMLSEYLASHELTEADRALIAGFLVPLTLEELDISESFLIEARNMASVIAYLRAERKLSPSIRTWLRMQLTQPNATANRNYVTVTKRLIELSRLPAADYARAIAAPERSDQRTRSLSLADLYNPGGKSGIGALSPDYIGRVHDLDALILAVRLQFELSGIERGAWADSIRNSSITQPYTGAPFDYSAEDATLSFACPGTPEWERARCRVQLGASASSAERRQ